MLSILARYKISHRLISLIAIVLVGLGLLTWVSLSQLDERLLDAKVASSKDTISLAYSVLQSEYKRFQEQGLSEEEAKASAIRLISELRYGNGNYVWINDMQPRMINHPLKPSLNGKDISQVTDPHGKHLFVEMVKRVRESGEGSVDYMWPLPGKTEPVDKVSYVMGFQPWGWVLGTGVYLEDVKSAARETAELMVLVSATIIVLLVILAMLVIQSITRPIKSVSDALAEIAQGQGDLTKTLPVIGRDEMSLLAQRFNDFNQQLRSLLSDVVSLVHTQDSVSSQLRGDMLQSTKMAEQQKNRALWSGQCYGAITRSLGAHCSKH